MRKKTWVIFVIFILFGFWPVRYVLTLAGLATFVPDAPDIIRMFEVWVTFISKIFDAPPTWFSVLIISFFTFGTMIWMFWEERFIKPVLWLFRRDLRIAELQKFSDDAGIRAYKIALCAKKLRNSRKLERLSHPELPSFKTREQASGLARDNYEHWEESFTRRRPIEKIEKILDAFCNSSDLEQSIAGYRSKVINSGERAMLDRQNWGRYENARFFPNEEVREKWHRTRGEVDTVNKFLEKIEASLQKMETKWASEVNRDVANYIRQELECWEDEEKKP